MRNQGIILLKNYVYHYIMHAQNFGIIYSLALVQKYVMSGRVGKWVYAFVEYNMKSEHLKAMKGQVVADFIVDHSINDDEMVCAFEVEPWKLFFDWLVCNQGQGVGCVIVSPHGVEHEVSIRPQFKCTNNQTEYEAF
jgi:hypothetical protein